jgi:2-phosphosulfolactate phosphatase
VRIDVAFTPADAVPAPIGIVVDVMRATSTIAQALASGYERVYCAAGIDEARAVREALGEGVLGGEREAVRIPGFDLGASPREVLDARASTLIMSTTNGTMSIVAASAACDVVLLGSLLNLDAVATEAARRGGDVVVLCAGYKNAFAIDDAYCAGRPGSRRTSRG